MANRRRRYCVYFSRRNVDVFNTFYFVFKNFYFLCKIFYFLSTIFYFVSKIFNFRHEKAKKTYVIFEIVWKVRPPTGDLAFGAGSSFVGLLGEERRRYK